jgi:hypothetical protein
VTEPRGLERVARAGYFVALLLVLTPLADFILNVTPLRPGSVDWRYGVVGLFSGFLLTPLLGMVLATLLAVGTNRRPARLAVGVLDLLFGVVLLLLVPLFVLDFFQLRASVPQEQLASFHVEGPKAMLKHLTAGLAFAWLGVSCLRSLPRSSRRDAPDLGPVVR